MKVKVLENLESPALLRFFDECRANGFMNNVSAKSIKYHWAVSERNGKFWAIERDRRVIGMAGCHWMPEISPKAYRIQFRGCELPKTDVKKTLSRSQFNSFTFRELIPYQLEWIESQGDYDVYLTTNHDNRNHRAMELIAQQGFLERVDDGEYFGVMQTVWLFNRDFYLKVRKRLRSYIEV